MTDRSRPLWTLIVAAALLAAGCGPGQQPAASPEATPPPAATNATPRPADVPPERIAAVTSDGKLVLLRPDGAVEKTLAKDAQREYPTGVAWSPDGRFIHYVRASTPERPITVVRIPADGGKAETADAGFAPTVSPDGSRLAFIRVGPDARPDEVVVRDLLTLGDEVWNLEDLPDEGQGAFVHSVAWAPDSQRLAYLIALEFGGDVLVVDTKSQRGLSLWRGTRIRPADDAASWNWIEFRGPGGKIAAVRGCCPPDFTLGWWLIEMDAKPTSVPVTLMTLPGTAGPIDYDSTGNHLLYVRDGTLFRRQGEGDPVQIATGITDADWH